MTLSAAMLASGTASAAGGRLLVFLHLAVKQRALQGMLQAALDGITVTAVGRIGDLERGRSDGQDAILTLPAVLKAQNLTVQLQGIRLSSAEETYALVGVDAVPDLARVQTVGAIDFLGRDGTTSFVQGLLGTQPKVERVTKFEDLLPLLQMQTVDAILLPSRFFSDLKSASRLNLMLFELTKRVGLPAVAVVGPAGASVVAAISRLSADAMKAIGVDSWR